MSACLATNDVRENCVIQSGTVMHRAAIKRIGRPVTL